MQINNSIKIAPNDVLWVKGEINYSRIYFKSDISLVVCCTLKEMERRLNVSHKFVRVHRTYLVNIMHLSEVNLERREVRVYNKTLPIARRRLEKLSQVSLVIR